MDRPDGSVGRSSAGDQSPHVCRGQLRQALDDAIRSLDEQLGLERLRCLHVNDAAVALGANRDRHEVVPRGLIGSGLATFLGHPAFEGLPAVLETWPEEGLAAKDIGELRRLHRLGRRRRQRRAR